MQHNARLTLPMEGPKAIFRLPVNGYSTHSSCDQAVHLDSSIIVIVVVVVVIIIIVWDLILSLIRWSSRRNV